ncbi:hypothetical protein BTJ45_02936 [Bacillus mycoides]|nr:hypothetical protein BTJ45_02936 [Bacillus mycoides]
MKNLTKKEFAEMWNKDGSKNGSAWQKIEKEINLLCRYEKTGRNRGTRYNILEVYDVPKEKTHGNAGKEPVNKGVIDKNSLKYKMAKVLIELGQPEYYESKSYYLGEMGFKSGNIQHIQTMFEHRNYSELDTIDKFVFTQVQNLQLSLNRFIGGAFDLIRKGAFDDVTLQEELWVAYENKTHEEAQELVGLYPLYEEARAEAREIVKQNYGNDMFFTTREKFITAEYEGLIHNELKYKPLFDNGIVYFYKKYAIDKKMEKPVINYDYEVESYDGGLENEHAIDEEVVYDFFCEFVSHRKKCSIKNIGKLIKEGITGAILNKEIMIEFAQKLFSFIFVNGTYPRFKQGYESMIEDVKKSYEQKIEETVNEALSGLSWNM